MAEPNFQFDLDEALYQQPKSMLRDPFGSKEAPYFATEMRNQQQAMLEHLSRYSALLLVVEGEHGSGKTTFMQEFARHQVDSAVISQVHGTMLMTAGQLLAAIYAGFADLMSGIKIDATFAPLLKFAGTQEEQGKSALVLVDNAHELNTDAITMLLDMMSLASENQAVPHIVLFTEQPLQRNLDAFQRQRFEQLSHQQRLNPYSFEEVRAYMLHRIRSVAGEINLPFNDKQLKQIYQQSEGYPGRVNRLAQALMGVGKGQENAAPQKRFGINLALGFPLVHMALLSVVMLGILLAVVFNEETDTTTAALVVPERTTPTPNPQTSQTIARIEEMQRRLNADGSRFELPPIPVDAVVSERQSTPITAAPVRDMNAIAPISTAPISTAAVVAPVRVTPAPIALITPTSTAPTSTAPTTQAAAAPAANPVEVSSDRFEKTAWWLTQPSNRYSLQLLGTYNLNTVRDFIRQQGSLDNFSYFKTLHNERDWYVVLYGSFRNRSEAIAAVENLPSDLKSLNPWARSVSGIQQDIRKAQ